MLDLSNGRLVTVGPSPGTSTNLDVFTGRAIAVDSEEHVLPSFLGGRLRVRGLIDKATNDVFGSSVDAALAEALQVFRVSMDARSHRGDRPPPPMKGVEGSDGAKYGVDPGGAVRVTPRMTAEYRAGRLHIRGTFPDIETAENLLRKFAKRKRLDVDRVVEQARAIAQPHRCGRR
jgi:hypothetical protein